VARGPQTLDTVKVISGASCLSLTKEQFGDLIWHRGETRDVRLGSEADICSANRSRPQRPEPAIS
jgi:hypothetical protein